MSLLSKLSLTAIVFMVIYPVRPLALDSIARVYASRPPWVFYAGGSLCEKTDLRENNRQVYDCLMQDGGQRCLVRQGNRAKDVTEAVRRHRLEGERKPLCSLTRAGMSHL